MFLAFVEKLPLVLRGRLGLTLFACIGMSVTWLGYIAFRQADAKVIARDFESRHELRHAFLQQSLNEYENALFALRLVVENNLSLESKEFERAAQAIQERSPGIYSIQWVPELQTGQIPNFLVQARALVDPAFAIKQRQPDGSFVPLLDPPPPGTPHAVITYLTPLTGNEKAIGYDILTGPTAEYLKAARRSGAILLTPAVGLVQGFDGVVLICYARRTEEPEGPPRTGPGYIQFVLQVRQVAQTLWNRSPSPSTDFALYDISQAKPVPLYTQLASHSEPAPLEDLYDFTTPQSITRDLVFAGRTLRASYRPAASWLPSRRAAAPTLLLAGGLLLTLLGVAYLRQLLIRTERIRSEVAKRTVELSESRAFLDTIIRHSPSALWVKNAELRYTLVNQEFCRIYDLVPSDIIGRSAAFLMSETDRAEAERADREVLAAGRTLQFENSYLIKGRLLTYLVGKFPLRDTEGAVYAVGGVASDVTERREAETERANIERRLLESQKLESLGVMAGGIAHDFNNLLTGIIGHANLSRLMLAPSAPVQDSLAQIEHAAGRAAELCQQMLAYSGRSHFVIAPAEMGALVRGTLPLLGPSLTKRARLDCEFAANLPSIDADLGQLRQIIISLIMNASESFGTNPGVITVRTRLVPATRALFAACVLAPELPPGDYVCLEISDNGCGMSPDTLARIFDPFYTTKFTGRGLGLPAVLGITRGHQAALRVISAPGLGSTFYLYFPAATSESAVRTSPVVNSVQKSTAAPATGKSSCDRPPARRLLLVDDEESVRDIAYYILVSLGYEVDTAGDGREALERFRVDPVRYHAAIIDLTMPGLSAQELLPALRALRPDFPILLLSGYSEEDTAPLLTGKHTGFLPKPFNAAALNEKLDALLGAA